MICAIIESKCLLSKQFKENQLTQKIACNLNLSQFYLTLRFVETGPCKDTLSEDHLFYEMMGKYHKPVN